MSDVTSEQLNEIKEAFTLFDRDADGIITTKEIGTVMRALGLTPSERELNYLIASIDKDGQGTVNLQTFIQLVSKRIKSSVNEKDLTEAFRTFDVNGRGFVSAGHLKHIMTTLGEKLSDEEVDEMIKDGNVNSAGDFDYKAFIKVFLAESR